MPHRENVIINGVKAPSVNEVTDLIPKPWLKEWRKKVGEDVADNIRDTAAKFGSAVHYSLESYLKGNVAGINPDHMSFVASLKKYLGDNKIKTKPEWTEPMWDSNKFCYHGSIDFLGERDGELGVLDHKIKGDKPLDYKTALNMTAYCALTHENLGIMPSWFAVLFYDKETGNIVRDDERKPLSVWWNDFLALRKMYDLNTNEIWNRAERFDRLGKLL